MAFKRITIKPGEMRGACPVFTGVPIPVATVIGRLRPDGPSIRSSPTSDLEAQDITASLEYAAAAVQERELPLTRPA